MKVEKISTNREVSENFQFALCVQACTSLLFLFLFQWEKELNPDPCHDGSEADVPESSVIDSVMPVISTRPIPYPLPAEYRQRHHSISIGEVPKPVFHIPPVRDGTCQYGYVWSSDNPVSSEWLVGKCRVVALSSIVSQRADIIDGLTDCAGGPLN